MNQEQIQYWLNKGKWTAEEASFLLLDIDPREDIVKKYSEDFDFFYSVQDKNSFLDSLPAETRAKLLKADEVKYGLRDKIEIETRASGLMYADKAPYYLFQGAKLPNPFRAKSATEIEIPKELFREYAEEEIFPEDKEYADIPIFGLFHSLDDSKISAEGGTKGASQISQEERSEELSRPAPAPIERQTEAKDMEIISGITVHQIKRFIDSKSDDYRPRLEVLIRVLIRLAGKSEGTILYETTLKTECEELLKAQEIGSRTHEGALLRVAKGDIDAIKRIISKNKVTMGGRPQKDQEK